MLPQEFPQERYHNNTTGTFVCVFPGHLPQDNYHRIPHRYHRITTQIITEIPHKLPQEYHTLDTTGLPQKYHRKFDTTYHRTITYQLPHDYHTAITTGLPHASNYHRNSTHQLPQEYHTSVTGHYHRNTSQQYLIIPHEYHSTTIHSATCYYMQFS